MSISLAQHIRDSCVMSYCGAKERRGINILGKEKKTAFSLIHVFVPAKWNRVAKKMFHILPPLFGETEQNENSWNNRG